MNTSLMPAVSALDRNSGETNAPISLTPRELEVLVAVFSGKSAKEIAEELFLSKRTVEFHLANVYRKLNVSNKVGAMRACLAHGLLTQEQVFPQ